MAKRRHDRLEYLSDIGQAAYLSAGELQSHDFTELFLRLSSNFVQLRHILEAIRGEYLQMPNPFSKFMHT
jgi:hypothetical protein